MRRMHRYASYRSVLDRYEKEVAVLGFWIRTNRYEGGVRDGYIGSWIRGYEVMDTREMIKAAWSYGFELDVKDRYEGWVSAWIRRTQGQCSYRSCSNQSTWRKWSERCEQEDTNWLYVRSKGIGVQHGEISGMTRSTRRQRWIDSKNSRHAIAGAHAWSIRSNRFERNRFEGSLSTGNMISNRSYLKIYKSKCYEIFTKAYIHIEECSHQISARLDDFLIDSNIASNRSQSGPGFPESGQVGPLTCQNWSPFSLGEISASYTYK